MRFARHSSSGRAMGCRLIPEPGSSPPAASSPSTASAGTHASIPWRTSRNKSKPSPMKRQSRETRSLELAHQAIHGKENPESNDHSEQAHEHQERRPAADRVRKAEIDDRGDDAEDQRNYAGDSPSRLNVRHARFLTLQSTPLPAQIRGSFRPSSNQPAIPCHVLNRFPRLRELFV